MSDTLLTRLPQCPICGVLVRKKSFTISGTEILHRKNYILTIEERDWLASTTFPVMHCTGCGLYFHQFVPSERLSEALYNRWIPLNSSLAKVQDNPVGYLYFLSYLLNIHGYYCKDNSSLHGRSLLEVGCGWGKFMEMAQLFGLQTSGVEYTHEKLSYVREKGMLAYLPEELPTEATFDIVAMLQVLEHLPSPFDFVHQYACRVKPGGLFIVEVPNCNHLAIRRILYRIVGREIFGAYQPLEHVNCFTSHSLDQLMSRVGFFRLRQSQRCIKTRLGIFCFRRSLVGMVAETILGSTGRIYVRNNERH
ncbi:MAG: methyltransferase domain-containing protein [Geobacter sp.]|nr:methyltransferase domain-containing protein [Geobacter sp.]